MALAASLLLPLTLLNAAIMLPQWVDNQVCGGVGGGVRAGGEDRAALPQRVTGQQLSCFRPTATATPLDSRCIPLLPPPMLQNALRADIPPPPPAAALQLLTASELLYRDLRRRQRAARNPPSPGQLPAGSSAPGSSRPSPAGLTGAGGAQVAAGLVAAQQLQRTGLLAQQVSSSGASSPGSSRGVSQTPASEWGRSSSSPPAPGVMQGSTPLLDEAVRKLPQQLREGFNIAQASGGLLSCARCMNALRGAPPPLPLNLLIANPTCALHPCTGSLREHEHGPAPAPAPGRCRRGAGLSGGGDAVPGSGPAAAGRRDSSQAGRCRRGGAH